MNKLQIYKNTKILENSLTQLNKVWDIFELKLVIHKILLAKKELNTKQKKPTH